MVGKRLKSEILYLCNAVCFRFSSTVRGHCIVESAFVDQFSLTHALCSLLKVMPLHCIVPRVSRTTVCLEPWARGELLRIDSLDIKCRQHS